MKTFSASVANSPTIRSVDPTPSEWCVVDPEPSENEWREHAAECAEAISDFVRSKKAVTRFPSDRNPDDRNHNDVRLMDLRVAAILLLNRFRSAVRSMARSGVRPRSSCVGTESIPGRAPPRAERADVTVPSNVAFRSTTAVEPYLGQGDDRTPRL